MSRQNLFGNHFCLLKDLQTACTFINLINNDMRFFLSRAATKFKFSTI